MCALLRPHDVRQNSEMTRSLDFNNRLELQPVAQVFPAEITNIIRLTEMEKLFHLRIIDDKQREQFSFLPGQFVMLEVPGFGEVPISISSSLSLSGPPGRLRCPTATFQLPTMLSRSAIPSGAGMLNTSGSTSGLISMLSTCITRLRVYHCVSTRNGILTPPTSRKSS